MGFLQFVGYELVIIPGLIALAALVGYLPALAAYRTDVAKALDRDPLNGPQFRAANTVCPANIVLQIGACPRLHTPTPSLQGTHDHDISAAIRIACLLALLVAAGTLAVVVRWCRGLPVL